MGGRRPPPSWYRTFLYEDFTLAIAVPIIILNTTEVVYIVKKKLNSRFKKSSFLILSLCVSDLLLGVNIVGIICCFAFPFIITIIFILLSFLLQIHLSHNISLIA